MLASARAWSLRVMNLPAALATGVSIAAYTVVDGIGVRVSGNWVAYHRRRVRVFSRRAAVVVARPARDVLGTDGGNRQGCRWWAISLSAYGAIIWAMQAKPDGCGLGVA